MDTIFIDKPVNIPEFFPEKPFDANTGRKWADYIQCLKLPPPDSGYYKGKTIIDVGAGFKGEKEFNNGHLRTVEEIFPNVRELIAIDPTYVINGKGAYPLEQYSDFQKQYMSRDIRGVTRKIGVVQKLPVKDFSADEIWSLMALPLHLPTDHEGKMFLEFLRVLKPGGKIRLAPFAHPSNSSKQSISEASISTLLEKFGYTMEYFDIPRRTNAPYRGVIISAPDETVEDARARIESFQAYLQHMNLVASPDKEWTTDHFNRRANTEPLIQTPQQKE